MMSSYSNYSKKLKSLAPFNDLVLQKLEAWEVCNAASTELVLDKNTGKILSFTRPENPHLNLADTEKDMIMMEFVRVMKYEGYNCDHTDRWEVTLIDGSWRLPVDAEPIMPFTESIITHIDNNHRNHIRLHS